MRRSNRLEIGVVGDLSGRPHAERDADRPPRFERIDRDDFERLFERLAPRVELALPFTDSVELQRFDDLHPDGLVDRLPALAKLLEAREAVAEPERMRRLLEGAGVGSELLRVDDAPEAEPTAVPRAQPAAVTEAGLLDDMLSGSSEAPAPPIRRTADPAFHRLIDEIASASADQTDYAQRERFRRSVDAELSCRMAAVLHQPAFQRLESTWRSLLGLVRQIEEGTVRVRALDLSADALRSELASKTPLEESTLHRLVVRDEKQTPGGDPFDLLVVDFSVEDDPEDLRLLAHLGEVAAAAQAWVVAAAGRSVWETEHATPSSAWTGARGNSWASRVALCAPRVLLRLPYGAETDPAERFAFEELAPDPGHEQYLWGNPAFLFARAAAQAWTAAGSLEALPDFAELTGLPVHVHRRGDETVCSGPTEKVLTDAEIKAIIDRGAIPLSAPRGGDSAVIRSLPSFGGKPSTK